MKQLCIALLLIFSIGVSAQQMHHILSDDAEISLITIGPGPELYDAFGHTAIRVEDRRNDIDTVFNYGVFNFDTPNFYLKFARGKLLYKLAAYKYEDFEYSYKAQKRWIKSQALNLDSLERQQTYNFLNHNLKESNRYYKYDFFYDNCATRPFNALNTALGTSLKMDYSEQENKLSHRDLIHQYLPWNSWGSLGIDIALGSVIDRTARPEEYLFLPNELLTALQNAQVNSSYGSKALVKDTITTHLPDETHNYGSIFILSPFFVFLLISLLICYKTYRDYVSQNGLGWLDTSLLMLTGITGLLLTFLWLGTDHTATAWNYNLLWAFPFHILASLVVAKEDPPRWIYPYMKLALILMVLLFLHWSIGVQDYPLAILPLLLAITMRYFFILKSLKAVRDS